MLPHGSQMVKWFGIVPDTHLTHLAQLHPSAHLDHGDTPFMPRRPVRGLPLAVAWFQA